MSAVNRIFGHPSRRRPQPPAPVVVPQPDGEPANAELPTVPVFPGRTGRTIRVTSEEDGELINRGYSYWSQLWIDANLVLVFCGHASGRPRFFQVNLETGEVLRLGPMLDYIGTSEGWYWTPNGRLMIPEGPRLHRVNPFNHQEDDVVLDISDTHPGCRLWQCHSSDDGNAHSGTVEQIVESGPYVRLGTVAMRNGALTFFGANGPLDESQISRDGRYLVIKEGDDNRIINLTDGSERFIPDANGALGHSDNGPAYAVGEDNQIGACVRVNLENPDDRLVLLRTWNMGHVSVRGGRCVRSGPELLTLVDLNGGGESPLTAHGMVPSDYDHQVHGNLDHTGRVACYLSDVAGRMDIYLVIL